MKKLSFILPLALGTVLMSCGGNKEAEENKETIDSAAVAPVDTTPVTVNEETKFKFDFAIANIPSPVGMVNDISHWGVNYNDALFNDTKKASTYTNEFVKAVNLGVYNIDLSYAMVNDKGEDVMKLMKTVMVQSDALGLKGAVDQMVGKRAEQNLANKDSLLRILDEIFVKSDSYLRTNERVYVASSVFAGTWIEGLYLACKLGENVTDEAAKANVYKTIWDQRFYLNNLTTLLEDYKDKKEVVELNTNLKAIHKEINDIKDPKDMNADKFKSISSKIIALRDKITK